MGKSTTLTHISGIPVYGWAGGSVKIKPGRFEAFNRFAVSLVEHHDIYAAHIRASINRSQRVGEGLVDEGIYQRALTVALATEGDGAILEYCREMPLVGRAAVFRAPLDVIIERNRRRSPSFARVAGRMVDATDIARDVLINRGVDVLDIDATKGPEANASALMEFYNAD